jgi:hypothetical protein
MVHQPSKMGVEYVSLLSKIIREYVQTINYTQNHNHKEAPHAKYFHRHTYSHTKPKSLLPRLQESSHTRLPV